MYLNVQGNVTAICVITKSPTYKEEAGESKVEMTKACAKCQEMTREGMQVVPLDLIFFKDLALPAMKIKFADVIQVWGRESSRENARRGKNFLDRTLIVEAWRPRVTDPMGMAKELEVRMEINARDNELRHLFAQYMTECKPLIREWVTDAIQGKKE